MNHKLANSFVWSKEGRSVWVVLNGEICNYRELTAGLLALGHRFANASDTGTLGHVYEEHGADYIRYLRGMFALAIWDARSNKRLLGDSAAFRLLAGRGA